MSQGQYIYWHPAVLSGAQKKTIVSETYPLPVTALGRDTDPENVALATPTEIGSSFASVTAEIDVRGYSTLTIFIDYDRGTSVNTQLRILHLHTSGGSKYREVNIDVGNPGVAITSVNLNDYELNTDVDQLFKLNIDATGSAFIILQVKDDANGDGQLDSIHVIKT